MPATQHRSSFDSISYGSGIRLNWAPEQIAGWLKRAHPEDECYQVSHETIYRSLFVQARGALKKELLYHLRSKRTIRRSKHAAPNGAGPGQIHQPLSIPPPPPPAPPPPPPRPSP